MSFLLGFGLLLPGVYPGMASDDSPETALVCAGLDVGHPPGYPLHSLLGRLALLCLPGGQALGLNILAAGLMALAGALAAVLAMAWALELGLKGLAPPLAACGAALSCAAGGEWLLQAGLAKGSVFALELCLALGTALALQVRRPRLACLLAGLALSNHYLLFLPVLPALALLLPARGVRPRLSHLAWLLPGLSLWAYLPLRAAHEPFLNWGAARSWEAFAAHVLRGAYAPEAQPAYGWGRALAEAGLGLGADLPWVLLALAGAGLSCLLARGRAGLGPACLAWLGAAWPVAAYAAYEPDNLAQLGAALLPAKALAGILAGLGAAWLSALLSRPALRLAAGTALAAALAVQAQSRASAAGHAWDFFQEDYAAHLAQSLPRASLLVAGYDSDLFSFWALQALRHSRVDVEAASLELWEEDWARERLRARRPGIFDGQGRAPLRALIEARPGGTALLFSRRPGPDYGMPWLNLAPRGIAWIALREGRPPLMPDGGAGQKSLWRSFAFRSPPPSGDPKVNFRCLNPQASAAAGMARMLESAGAEAEAAWWWRECRRLNPAAPVLLRGGFSPKNRSEKARHPG